MLRRSHICLVFVFGCTIAGLQRFNAQKDIVGAELTDVFHDYAKQSK